ncbi:hypothetical protein LCGC14_2345140 [marine sediment metagenome]|uniref:TRASH domain-containing protein n=1 Tax=marine sediment metagenome TaxID=412755 RepID=A0A0F9CYC2_9ZZZZ
MNRDIAESLTHDHVNNTHQHLDPVCGMEVDPATAAASQEHDGRRYYFCSAGCAEKFQADPSEYVAQTGTSKRPAPSPAAQEHPAGTAAGTKAIYTCPMHPDVRQEGPGACPECGMALEPLVPLTAAKGKTQYICPMHLEIVRDEPASCPICGMALEPRTAAGDGEQEDPEFTDMMRRLWISGVLSVPLLVVAMAPMLGGQWFAARVRVWIELALATPVVLWCGWPLLARGWRSIVTLKLNMFTLVSIGVVTAWAYSVLATIAPGIFPASFRAEGGTVEVYFEAAGVITTLVLLGQVLELRARRQFDQRLVYGDAIVAYETDTPVVEQGQDGHCAGMPYDFANVLGSVSRDLDHTNDAKAGCLEQWLGFADLHRQGLCDSSLG